MKRLLCVLVVAFALVGRLDAQLVAYDEFDGSARGGWKQTGLGEWAIDSARLERGAFVTVDGNHWRELAHPVTRATVWYAATFRMRAAPVGDASIVPASDRSSQFSEFGFNSAYGATGFVTAASPGGGPIATGIDATATQTILARYDLASGTWSAWASAGDGRDLVDASGRVVREPLVDDAPLASDSLGFLYLTKGSRQELEVERLALAATARDALTPVAAGTPTQELAPEPVVPPSPGIAALLASPDLRIGERIACYGDSITWQGGWIEVLEKAFARHAPEKHVVFLNRGLNGATSTDLRDGVDDLFGQTRGDFVSELAKDRPSLVVIFVGVNDVSREHAKNSVDAYATAIEELVDAADRDHRRVVVCTPAVIGERKHGANPRDAALDEYALAAMHSAWTSDAPPDPKSGVLRVAICNLRGAFARELERLNTDDRESGVLTYDGVHMLPAGNALIADEIASSLASAI
ncbi:MAG: hypothetical protein IT453_18660, partial [Planctomycetes bacterium]|nr:hypothetical protein [Planctomycetota bacterium]